MNTVSFIIYLTYVIPTLGTIFGVATVVLGFTTLIGIIAYFCAQHDASSYRASEDDKRFPTTVLSMLKLAGFSFATSLILAVVLPNQQTMYMIAASELGEEVIVSPEAKELYQDLRDVLSSYKKTEEAK